LQPLEKAAAARAARLREGLAGAGGAALGEAARARIVAQFEGERAAV